MVEISRSQSYEKPSDCSCCRKRSQLRAVVSRGCVPVCMQTSACHVGGCVPFLRAVHEWTTVDHHPLLCMLRLAGTAARQAAQHMIIQHTWMAYCSAGSPKASKPIGCSTLKPWCRFNRATMSASNEHQVLWVSLCCGSLV